MNYFEKYSKYKSKYLKEFKKVYSNFEFDPTICDQTYMTKVKKLFKEQLDTESFNLKTKQEIQNELAGKPIECDYEYSQNLCTRDDFFTKENSKQIVLGRYDDIVGCYYNCDDYFALAIKDWTVFKNDYLIKYLIDKSRFKDVGLDLDLDPVFPVRIIISKKKISRFSLKTKGINNDKPYYNTLTDTIYTPNITKQNQTIIDNPKYTLLNEFDNDNAEGAITSRELCLLMQTYKIYMVSVVEENKENKEKWLPLLLVSKQSINEINKLYANRSYIKFYEIKKK